MKRLDLLLIAGIPALALGPGDSRAQAASLCGVGDSACYTREYETACAQRGVSTREGCTEWISSIEARARPNDSAAWLAVAGARALVLDTMIPDAEGKARNRAAVLGIYRKVASADPANAEALLGIATLTDDSAERMRLLRRVEELRPSHHSGRLDS
jgi:hypothetical protein